MIISFTTLSTPSYLCRSHMCRQTHRALKRLDSIANRECDRSLPVGMSSLLLDNSLFPPRTFTFIYAAATHGDAAHHNVRLRSMSTSSVLTIFINYNHKHPRSSTSSFQRALARRSTGPRTAPAWTARAARSTRSGSSDHERQRRTTGQSAARPGESSMRMS